MKFPYDARFQEERSKYDLRFTCEDCAYFQPETTRCTHGFDTRSHRAERYAAEAADVLFCKEFELF